MRGQSAALSLNIKQVVGQIASVLSVTSLFNINEANFTPRKGRPGVIQVQHVLVLSSDKQPLDPCHPARARQLLKAGKAAVLRRYPFTIILKDRTADEAATTPHRVKLDPGSKTTGIALVSETTGKVVWAAELRHRGQAIKNALDSRRALRRSRRNRKTRYRQPRVLNRRKAEGWLAPSLMSRVYNITTWVNRLRRLAPVTALSMELVKFDTQAMQNPEVSGVEYQQGELAGYEVREYLLEKWGRKCAYCGATNTPLEIEHIIPRSRGGSNRVSNLTLACHDCNQRKGNKTAAEFGHPDIQGKAKQPLKDAAAVNATRRTLWRRLSETGLPIECGTGGRTKYNRVRLGLPKAHYLDAACVGESGADVIAPHTLRPMGIKAMGHGRRLMCATDAYGFRRRKANGTYCEPKSKQDGWKTGDLARAAIPRGKYAGTHTGRIVVRRGSFKINGIPTHRKYLTALHRADGYDYSS